MNFEEFFKQIPESVKRKCISELLENGVIEKESQFKKVCQKCWEWNDYTCERMEGGED